MTPHEEQQHELLLSSNACSRALLHITMAKYELDCAKSDQVQVVKKILADSVNYYDKTLKIRLKNLLNEEAYALVSKYLDNGKVLELQDIMQHLFDVNLAGLQEINEVLKKATYVKAP